jgi:nucleoside-diphosphate-sugar epimerase
MGRVLLVGGSGFLGLHAARALAAAGHAVTVLSRGRRAPVPGAEPLLADRAEAGSLERALAGRAFELTVDFGAFDAPDVERLLDTPRFEAGRYVMISTGQVYLITTGRHPPYREGDEKAPRMAEPPAGTYEHASWRYGVLKVRAEEALAARVAAGRLRGLALRCPILQGEGDGSLRLWGWIERLLDGAPVPLPDGGGQRLRHLWAGDLGGACVKLLEGPWPARPAYNLAPPDSMTLRELLERTAAVAGVEARLQPVPTPLLRAAGIGPGDLPYASGWSSVLDPAAAVADWGFEARPMADYLPQVVRWHLEARPESDMGYARRAAERALLGPPGHA